jgi:hypothetical protein
MANTCNINDIKHNDQPDIPISVKPKRGRRSKQQIALDLQKEIDDKRNGIIIEHPPNKKRGRKSKGGKFINNVITEPKQVIPIVMLHLKCSMSDICDNEKEVNDPSPYNNAYIYSYEKVNNNPIPIIPPPSYCDNTEEIDYSVYNNKNTKKNNDILFKKLDILKKTLHGNDVCNKQSDCFWCTCYFDNPTIYIPKYILNNVYNVYGCFCSPECASSYLMNEKIDITEKFERYQLLNNLYGSIYNYSKNIKCAPNPYYTLNKYYGNLSIQEYRLLTMIDKTYYITNKPLTMVSPELQEYNGSYISHKLIDPNNNTNKSTNVKNNIVKNAFGAI